MTGPPLDRDRDADLVRRLDRFEHRLDAAVSRLEGRLDGALGKLTDAAETIAAAIADVHDHERRISHLERWLDRALWLVSASVILAVLGLILVGGPGGVSL